MNRQVVLLALLLAAAITAHAQWDLQDSHSTADLRGIDNVGGGVAWASGTNGTVLRTEDSGYLWQSCSIPPGAEHLDFRGIQAFDANTAIVMSSGKGDLSRLYKTTDGCQTWKLVFANPDKDGFWDAVQFEPDQWGCLLGDPVKGMFVLFVTDNGGRTWTREYNRGLRARSSEQGAFAASNSSMAADAGFVTFASGGKRGAFSYSIVESEPCLDCSVEDIDYEGRRKKWDKQPVPIGSHSETSGVFSMAARRSGLGMTVAVGGNYESPDDRSATAAFTFDGGRTWVGSTTMPHGYRSAVAYDPATKTWITVGPNGTDVSTDDGRNWRALHSDPALHEPPDADRNWNALSLPYVVGPQGRVGKLNPHAFAPSPAPGK
jgi:hypothetical protein